MEPSIMELFLDEHGLVPEKVWKERLLAVKEKVGNENRNQLKKSILSAVRKRIPKKRFGIMFSGGVDSSLIALICKNLGADFICYTVGFQDEKMEVPPDLKIAPKVADALGVPIRIKVFSMEDAKDIIFRTKSIVPNKDPVSIGVGAVEMAVAELAKKDKIDFFLGGLGSEEIFAGYQRHAEADDVNGECWNGLINMWNRDLTRDCAMAKEIKFGVGTPFLDENVIIDAMGIPAEKKIGGGYKKVILREIAEELGLPKEFAWRKKKAAQYGSRFDTALAKMAKEKRLEKGEFARM